MEYRNAAGPTVLIVILQRECSAAGETSRTLEQVPVQIQLEIRVRQVAGDSSQFHIRAVHREVLR